MPTVTVSTSAQLTAALKSVQAGTTIELASGTYTLSLQGKDLHGASIVAANGADVTFTQVTLNTVSHLTFDGVDFADRPGNDDKLFVMASSTDVTIRNATFQGIDDASGYGKGVALWVNKTTGFTLENTHIDNFKTGSWLGSITDLTVRDNSYSDISLDGMIVGGIHNAVLEGNVIDLHVPSGVKHTDGMQFYNSGTNNPMSDVVIRDNHAETHNAQSHGIYMANGLADASGGSSTFFQGLTITGNEVISGQVSGIAVGQTHGLVIKDNIVLQDPAFPSTRDIGTPVIRVQKDSTDVSITDNVTHLTPVASGTDWYPVKTGVPAGWTITGNQIVARGTTLDSITRSQPTPDPDPTPDPTPSQPENPSDPVGNGQADFFRFDAKGATGVVSGLAFGEGDKVKLAGFDQGTFHDVAGGNVLEIAARGVLIDSLADMHELASASPKVHFSQGADDMLVMDIDQNAGTHTIQFLNMAHMYFDA